MIPSHSYRPVANIHQTSHGSTCSHLLFCLEPFPSLSSLLKHSNYLLSFSLVPHVLQSSTILPTHSVIGCTCELYWQPQHTNSALPSSSAVQGTSILGTSNGPSLTTIPKARFNVMTTMLRALTTLTPRTSKTQTTTVNLTRKKQKKTRLSR